MIEELSICSAVTVVRLAVFAVAVVAIAIWATRQPDQQSTLIEKLTGTKNDNANDDCVAGRFRKSL